MNESASTLRVALVGNPNCGKTALFNLLTGAARRSPTTPASRSSARKACSRSPSGSRVTVLDLPGAYSLHAGHADEPVTLDVIHGERAGRGAARPDRLRRRRDQPAA